MSGYVKNLKLVVPFDGDEVTLTLRHLSWEDFRTLTSARESASDTDVLMEWSKMLPRYVVEMRGLTDAAGCAIPIEEVASTAYFYPIVGRALRFVMEEAIVKNPKASDVTSTASSSEATPLTASAPVVTGLKAG